jgi:hypothetical protein
MDMCSLADVVVVVLAGYVKAGVVVYDMKPDPKIEYRPWEPGLPVTSMTGENGSLTPASFIEAWASQTGGVAPTVALHQRVARRNGYPI